MSRSRQSQRAGWTRAIVVAIVALPGAISAAPPQSQPASAPSYETEVHGRRGGEAREGGRAGSRVTRRELDERLPRSAPDAVRYEPGVYVQQSAHGQGSAYIRGRTGQQTVILFDGIRLNNSTFRQGPNQYFFTIDSRTVRAIDVVRGGASTLHGSDAIGGTIDAMPLGPELTRGASGLRVRPGGALRFASADGEVGGRAAMELSVGDRVGVLGGVGFRRVGRLRSGGALRTPARGNTPAGGWVPRFEDDGETQLGTGLSELTADARAVLRLRPDLRLVAAYYGYYQLDAPRTDKCPSAEAPIDACLTYEEQFRTLAYAALEGSLGGAANKARLVLSYQQQHERRLDDRPAALVQNGGRDDVHTIGVLARFESARWRPRPWVSLSLRYGGDFYFDRLDSAAWTRFTDSLQVIGRSRGQYIDGSRYSWGGLYLQPVLELAERLTVRAGARLALTAARAPGDEESGSRAINRDWLAAVGHAGLEWRARRWLTVLMGVDRSFRAPNLDDLTSRQETGPGFQIENPALVPEHALTLEGGLRVDLGWLQAEGWAYWARLSDAIEREPLPLAACPQAGGRSCLRLVNLRNDGARVYGAEGIAKVRLPHRVSLRATVAWARGDGVNPADPAAGDVPLSRVPPLNGTAEARWRSTRGFYAGAGLRWALGQDRLSLGDETDARIPPGGTPGFAVVDLRAGYRLGRRLLLAVVLENLADAAYRYHGSSVNGPGRGIVVNLEGKL